MTGKGVCEHCLGGQALRERGSIGKINGYSLYLCPECGLIYVFPKPGSAELDQVYAKYHAQAEQFELNQTGEKAFFGAILKHLRKYVAGGELLDIGASYGHFLALAQAQGFRTKGLDIAPEPCRYAREMLQLDVECQSLTEARFPSNRFAVITMLNVLEHVPDPYGVLAECFRIAQPGGLLAVVVPNFLLAYPYFILMRKLGLDLPVPTTAYIVPEHLSIFGAKSLRRMLEGSGWTPISLVNAPVIHNPGKIKVLFKKSIKALGDLLALITAQRFIYGYSLLAISRKPRG